MKVLFTFTIAFPHFVKWSDLMKVLFILSHFLTSSIDQIWWKSTSFNRISSLRQVIRSDESPLPLIAFPHFVDWSDRVKVLFLLSHFLSSPSDQIWWKSSSFNRISSLRQVIRPDESQLPLIAFPHFVKWSDLMKVPFPFIAFPHFVEWSDLMKVLFTFTIAFPHFV